MSYLLDTHTFLWFVNDNPALSSTAREYIEDPLNLIYLSTASIWEMAIKSSIRKLAVPSPLRKFLDVEIEKNEFALLGITTEYADVVAGIPFPQSGHRDPFDRLIIAQALCDSLTVISNDRRFDDYGIKRLW